MSESECRKLEDASMKAVTSGNVPHLIMFITEEGEPLFCGSAEIVSAFENNTTLKEDIKALVNASVNMASKKFISTKVPVYRKLPVSPFSPNFKGSQLIRTTLANLLMDAGYGGKGKRMHGKFLF